MNEQKQGERKVYMTQPSELPKTLPAGVMFFWYGKRERCGLFTESAVLILLADQLKRLETPPAQLEAKPPQPEATSHKRDPYAEHRERLAAMKLFDDVDVSAVQLTNDSARLARMTPKQRQALEQLKSPLPTKRSTILVGSSREWTGRRVSMAAPSTWPEDSGEELGHS